MAESEKRAHRRAAVAYRVKVRATGGAELEGVVDNLGALGALVSTPNLDVRLAVGDVVALAIEIEKRTVEAEGEILRLDQEFAGGEIRRTLAVKFREEIAS